MRARAAVLAVLSAWPSAGRADETRDADIDAAAPEGGRLQLSLRVRIGAAVAPFDTPALSKVESEFTQARLLVLAGQYLIDRRRALGARLPVAASTVMLPAGSYADDKALGNPELFIEDRGLTASRGPLRARAALRVAVGLPLAQHGSTTSLLENRALALSDALDGWRNPELYTAGVLPLTASGRLALSRARFGVDLEAKLPLAIRLHDASLPDEARTRPLGFTPHLRLGGTWSALPWLALGAAAHAVIRAPAPVAPPPGGRRASAFQLGIEPRAAIALGPLSLTADLMLALGGPLDGTIGIGFALLHTR